MQTEKDGKNPLKQVVKSQQNMKKKQTFQKTYCSSIMEKEREQKRRRKTPKET